MHCVYTQHSRHQQYMKPGGTFIIIIVRVAGHPQHNATISLNSRLEHRISPVPFVLSTSMPLLREYIDQAMTGKQRLSPCTRHEVYVHLHSILTSALDRGKWSLPRSGRFTPTINPRYQFNRTLPSSGLLHSVRWFETDVSGPPVPIFKGQVPS